jgi:hypothetical protein
VLAAALALSAAPALAADEPLSFRGGLTWINAFVWGQTLDDPRNPDNLVVRQPHDGLVSDLRPNLKVVSNSLQLIARPRITYTIDRAEIGDDLEPYRAHSDTGWSEAFAQWTLSEAVTLAYGKQSYQWGAAESLSPSNRMFHETVQARNELYDVRGKNVARVNLSLGKRLSAVLMSETEEDPDAPVFRAEEEFQTTSLAKLEVNWNNGADYFGVVGGAREHGAPWVGEYVSWTLPFWDAVAVYADASHQRGSDAWYPVQTGPVVTFDQARKDEDKVETIAVGGAKYDFENGNTIRVEYVLNEPGWTKDERQLSNHAFYSLAPEQLAVREQNLPRALNPGLELPGRRYAFLSLRLPSVFSIQDLTAYARALQALSDRTTSAYGSVEYAVGDAGAVLLSAAATNGEKAGELRGLTSPSYLAGYKHQW